MSQAFDIAARRAARFSFDHIEPHNRLAARRAAISDRPDPCPRCGGEPALDVPPGYLSVEEADRLMRESIEADETETD